MNGPYRFSACLKIALLLCLVLAGCAGISSRPPDLWPLRHELEDFLLEGRFSLRQDSEYHAGRLTWRHWADGDELLLASPFGQGLARIVAEKGMATLMTADGRRFSATDVASLTEQALAYRLPLERLTDWVRARVPEADVLARDAQGRLLRLRVDGWRIEYAYGSDEAQALPASILARRDGGFELRLRIDEWTSGAREGN
jgi:outer membrane lipoprotein LolB